MEGDLHLGVVLKDIEKGFIGPLVCFSKNEIEIPDRLVIVNGNEEVNLLQGVSLST